jgi:hypothetical protein
VLYNNGSKLKVGKGIGFGYLNSFDSSTWTAILSSESKTNDIANGKRLCLRSKFKSHRTESFFCSIHAICYLAPLPTHKYPSTPFFFRCSLLFCWLISRYAKPICFVAAGTCMSISYPVLSLFTFLHFLHLTDFYLDPRFPGRRVESLCKQYAFTFHLNYFLLSILCWA